jgi:hypothetical protein
VTALDLVPLQDDEGALLAAWGEDGSTNVRYMTRERARALTDVTRTLLREAGANLVELRAGSAHLALDYPDWHTFVEAEFGDLTVYRLVKDRAARVAERQALVASMTLAGFTVAEQRDALGSSNGTVHADQRRLGLVPNRPLPVEPEPEPVDPYRGLDRTRESLARVAAQGERGMTSLELDHETGWPLGTATGLLSRLERGRGGKGGGFLAFGEGLRERRMPYVLTGKGRRALDEALAARDAAELEATS